MRDPTKYFFFLSLLISILSYQTFPQSNISTKQNSLYNPTVFENITVEGSMKKEVTKIKPSYNLTALKLSKYKINKLKNISSELKSLAKSRPNNKIHRQAGHIVLFTGQHGTVKTKAANAIANELKLNLFRVDLSEIVSKYIGETEKNLNKLFKSVESKNQILFFDEADALFGKRSEVKDSHDRYANIEANYLLQRLEAYQGLVILATNKKNNIDDAFLRRLRYIINFPVPEGDKRNSLWEKRFHK